MKHDFLVFQPGFRRQLGIHTDATIPGLKQLTDTVHRHGALVGIQLFHGGRQASRACSGMESVAPSAIPIRWSTSCRMRSASAKFLASLAHSVKRRAVRATRVSILSSCTARTVILSRSFCRRSAMRGPTSTAAIAEGALAALALAGRELSADQRIELAGVAPARAFATTSMA